MKGPSVLYLIPGLDIIRGVIPDSMHCIFLGVVNLLLTLWLNFPNECYHIIKKDVKNSIAYLLSSVKPPSEMKRVFRSILKYLSVWKASEFRNFIFFYSAAVLKKLLPPAHYSHWFIFSKCSTINF